ncbi:MAG: hypothetical protein AAB373_02915 [Patescibacteria group bacterium]
MAYRISEVPADDETPEGWEIEFDLPKQPKVRITKENQRRLYLNSKTDGYHWFNFWAAQEPNAISLLELPANAERERVRQSLLAIGLGYIEEDKETCFLDSPEEVTIETVNRIANFLEPRFAMREKFFPDD